MRSLRLIVKRDFDAAHYLENYKGKCAETHGHRWILEAHIAVSNDKDLTIDFGDIKNIIDNILPDHKFLNNEYNFNPTAENLAKYFKRSLLNEGLRVEKVVLWESPTSAAEY